MATRSRGLSNCVTRRFLVFGVTLMLAGFVQAGAPVDDRQSSIHGAEGDTAPANERCALVYSGSCAGDDCPEAVAAVARDAGLKVRFVDDPDGISELLN